MRLAGCLLVLALGAFAQSEEPKINVDLDGFRYPPAARSNRIRGDVRFEISKSGSRLVAGHPILASAPPGRACKTWALLARAKPANYVVFYHFEFFAGIKYQPVPIGNKFDRFFRHLVGARTERVIDTCSLGDDPEVAPRLSYMVVVDGEDLRVDVFVDALLPCPVVWAVDSHL